MELFDLYAMGSSSPPNYYYIVTRQVLTTGLIVQQLFLTYSEIGATLDLRPSEVEELLEHNRLISSNHWFVITKTPIVKS